jgi:hypothetical protein
MDLQIIPVKRCVFTWLCCLRVHGFYTDARTGDLTIYLLRGASQVFPCNGRVEWDASEEDTVYTFRGWTVEEVESMAERNGTPLGVYDLLRYRGQPTNDPVRTEETRREMARRSERRQSQACVGSVSVGASPGMPHVGPGVSAQQSTPANGIAGSFWNPDDAADTDLAEMSFWNEEDVADELLATLELGIAERSLDDSAGDAELAEIDSSLLV